MAEPGSGMANLNPRICPWCLRRPKSIKRPACRWCKPLELTSVGTPAIYGWKDWLVVDRPNDAKPAAVYIDPQLAARIADYAIKAGWVQLEAEITQDSNTK